MPDTISNKFKLYQHNHGNSPSHPLHSPLPICIFSFHQIKIKPPLSLSLSKSKTSHFSSENPIHPTFFPPKLSKQAPIPSQRHLDRLSLRRNAASKRHCGSRHRERALMASLRHVIPSLLQPSCLLFLLFHPLFVPNLCFASPGLAGTRDVRTIVASVPRGAFIFRCLDL